MLRRRRTYLEGLVSLLIFCTYMGVAVARLTFFAKRPEAEMPLRMPTFEREIRAALAGMAEPEEMLPLHGTMESIVDKDTYTTQKLHARNDDHGFIFYSRSKELLAYSAMATDQKPYFANAFYLGYSPYSLTSPWLAAQLLARTIRYADDTAQYGVKDLWLTGPQLLRRRKGDCEDHAILLADWLRSYGYDARVVLGYTGKNVAHAWVALFYEGKVYLLESTDKTPPKRPPLAAVETDLRAVRMFNETSFWQYDASGTRNDYESSRWRRTARFVRDRPAQPPPPEEQQSPPLPPAPDSQKKKVKQKERRHWPPRRTLTAGTILVATPLQRTAGYLSERLAVLPQGTPVEILAEQGSWFKVRTSLGRQGYVLRQDVIASQ